jgi:O-antigen ligase
MKKQFFKKTFWYCLLGIAIAHLVAFFVLHTPIEGMVVVAVGLAVFGLSIWKLELGLLIAFTELIVGSHGHLFSLEWFSIRMAIFVAVILAWIVRVAIKRSQYRYDDARLYPWLLLGLAVAVGGIIGWARGNELINVFNDMNAYFYALYLLPMLSINWVATKKRQLLQVLSAGVTWLIVETLALLYVFSHASEGLEEILYTFFRDARIAELTRVSGDIFRVFLQSQFWVIVGLFVLISLCVLMWQRKQDRWLIYIGLVGAMATIVISMSRSFWLGVFVGILAALAFLVNKKIFKFIPAWKSFVGRVMIVGSAAVVSILLLWGIIAFPFPDNLGAGGLGSLLADRATELDEAAARSRWNLVEPMMLQIKKLPFTGSGFGTVLEYESEDPRVVALGGTAETYAFEWGWLDIWLKMGFLGILSFVWLFVFYVLSLWNSAKKGNAGWLMVAFLRSVVALFVLHIFTPFLNHPIGLGFLIFLIPFLTPSEVKLSFETVKEKMKTKKPAGQATPAMTSTTNTR